MNRIKLGKQAIPSATLTIEQATEKLNDQFGDMVSVQKAFEMLGNRKQITPQDYKRLATVIPKITYMAKSGGSPRLAAVHRSRDRDFESSGMNSNRSRTNISPLKQNQHIRYKSVNQRATKQAAQMYSKKPELVQIQKHYPAQQDDSDMSFDSALTPREKTRDRAKTMMGKVQASPLAKSGNSGMASKKLSLDNSRNETLKNNNTQANVAQAPNNAFHLPTLGRTVSASMTPNNNDQIKNSNLQKLAKQSSMMKSPGFRESENSSAMRNSMYSPDAYNSGGQMRGTGDLLSVRSSNRVAWLGQVQEKEQDRFWSNIINEDTRRHRIENERIRMSKFKQNQQVQSFLKDQMAHSKLEQDILRHRKGLDASEIRTKTDKFMTEMKQKTHIKRSLAEDTQFENKAKYTDMFAETRANLADHRQQSFRETQDNVEQAAYLDKLEKDQLIQKRMTHALELQKIIEQRARDSKLHAGPVTHDTARQLRLQPQQVEKLMLQEPSPLKYHNPATGLLSPLVEAQYVKQMRQKVREQDKRVDHFVQTRTKMLPDSGRGSPSASDLASTATGLARSDSSGLVAPLAAADDRRRDGTTAIARQIELENMKARQFRAHALTSEKNLALAQEQKLAQYLAKVNAENHQAEQHNSNIKRQQMRDNIVESLRVREEMDIEQAQNLVTKEAKLNKQYNYAV